MTKHRLRIINPFLYYVTSLYKVFERLIYDKGISTVANSITPHQFGFQKGHSTLQQLLLFFYQLITSKDEIDIRNLCRFL